MASTTKALATSRRSQSSTVRRLFLLPALKAFYFWRGVPLYMRSTNHTGDLWPSLGQLSQKEGHVFSTCSDSLLRNVLSLQLYIFRASELLLYAPLLASSEHYLVPSVPPLSRLLSINATTNYKTLGDSATLFQAEAEGLILSFLCTTLPQGLQQSFLMS